MPSRWLSLTIVACWLATTGWLFWHELWPRWRPGEPPPFHIDLVEEVQKGTKLKTYWNVELHKKDDKPSQDVKVFRASTWVDYQQEDDTFSLHAEFKALTELHARPFVLPGGFKVEAMASEYRVDRGGHLRELRAEVRVMPPKVLAQAGDNPTPLQVSLWAEVRGGQIVAHCRGSLSSSDRRVDIDLPPAPTSHNGSVLMPLHPVNRIHGLRPGQSWRQPLIDPFRDAVSSLPGFSGGVHQVNARVLPQPQLLEQSTEAQACLIIEYESEGEIVGRTWVEQDSERVRQQEAVFNGDTWIMKRDNLNNRFGNALRQDGIQPSAPASRNEP